MPSDLPRLVDPAERVVELLAIALFNADADGQSTWLQEPEERRDQYRRMARGEEPLP